MPGKDKDKKVVTPKKPPFYMAEGKAVTSKMGILGPGEEAKAEYFAGGESTLLSLVKSGHVVKA